MFISGLGLLTKSIILKLRRKDAQCTLGMRNSTGSPLFSDFKSDLSRVVRSRPLVKGTKTLGTRVANDTKIVRSRDAQCNTKELTSVFFQWKKCINSY